MPSDYLFGIFCPLYRLSFFDVCLLITPLVSFGMAKRYQMVNQKAQIEEGQTIQLPKGTGGINRRHKSK
jgi:hypothetical protein